MGKITLVACIFLVPALLAPVSAEEVLRVASSSTSLASLVEAIGGTRVETLTLIPMGADPHHYEPSQSDLVEALANADLILLTGPGHLILEERIRGLAEAGVIGAEILDYRDYMDAGLRLLENPRTGEPNIHGYYLSINGLRTLSERIADELIRLDSEGRAVYEANLKRYLELLDSIWMDAVSLIRDKPKVVLLTPILQYVMDDLGLEIGWVMLPEPDAEPSEADVEMLLELSRKGYVLVVSDLAAERYQSLLQLLSSENVNYVIVPILRLADKPHLITLTTALKLADISSTMEHNQSSWNSLLLVSFTANVILITLVALFYRRLRRLG